jgi:hypothetical protein
MSSGRSPLYPYLVALAFPLGLAISNIEELPGPWAAFSVFGFVLLMTAALDLAGRLVVRDPQRRALVVTVLVAFSLGYGHIDMALLHEMVYSKVLIPALLVGVVAPLVWLSLRVRQPERIGNFLRVTALTLVCVQVFSAVVHLMSTSGGEAAGPATTTAATGPIAGADAPKPDIYVIVLDAYTRADVLRQYNDHDNGPFLDALRERGFYIADEARSNYLYTRLSVSSSLNMRYLDEDIRRFGPSPARSAIDPLLRTFEVADRLKRLGYTYRHVGGFWHVTRTSLLADENVYYLPSFAEEFMFVFLRQTVFHPVLSAVPAYGDWFQPGLVHQQQLKNIAKPAGAGGPTFTFAHVMCPHPPYVFDRNGIRSADSSLTTKGRTRAYAEQVTYLNQQVLKVIDEIDRVSGRDAVILLHGDHGARSLAQDGLPEQNREQMAVLAAYRMPERARKLLYPGMSLVNNFRVLFTGMFGATDLPLLEDRTFYSHPDRIYEIREVDRAGKMLDEPRAAARTAQVR